MKGYMETCNWRKSAHWTQSSTNSTSWWFQPIRKKTTKKLVHFPKYGTNCDHDLVKSYLSSTMCRLKPWQTAKYKYINCGPINGRCFEHCSHSSNYFAEMSLSLVFQNQLTEWGLAYFLRGFNSHLSSPGKKTLEDCCCRCPVGSTMVFVILTFNNLYMGYQ